MLRERNGGVKIPDYGRCQRGQKSVPQTSALSETCSQTKERMLLSLDDIGNNHETFKAADIACCQKRPNRLKKDVHNVK